jgi:undecaprenyl-diphosphatase
MQTTKEWNCTIAAWLIILVALAVRLFISSRFLLVPDEANYWQWSRHLALGYHDHPPMIAWTIGLATRLFGQNEFAVRLPTVLGLAVTSFYLFALSARWFSRRCGFHVVLLLQGLLLLNGAALIATPDGLLLPCWAAACYHSAMALSYRSPGQWLLTGIWFGLGMLSKYTMLLFLPSLFFCMLIIPFYRKQLATVWPWFGLLVGLACFTPVLLWNSHNGWATFRHVLYQGGIDNSSLITLRYVVDFLGTQLLLLSPLVFLLLLSVWLSRSTRSRLQPADASFLISMSATTFVVFFLLSFHVRIYGNWPAAGYLSGIVLLAAVYSPGRAGAVPRTTRLWNIAVGTAYLLTVPILIQLLYPVLPLSINLDRIARETTGWDKLGLRVDQVVNSMPRPEETFIFGLRYQESSELAFYMPGQPETVSINKWARPNVYDYWFDDAMLLGKDGVGVYEWKGMAQHLSTLFDRIDSPEEINLYRISPWFGKQLVQTLYLIRGYGFKGGLRWQPKQQDDIRAVSKVVAAPSGKLK